MGNTSITMAIYFDVYLVGFIYHESPPHMPQIPSIRLGSYKAGNNLSWKLAKMVHSL